MNFKVKPLPPLEDVETIPVLKQLNAAERQLALLNGRSATIPNESILINTLVLQEAKDSSAVENIITTHDALYKAQLLERYFKDAAAKEVSRYADALKQGFELVRKQKLITQSTILHIQQVLEQNDAGYRKVPGTRLENDLTKEVVYIPPQHPDEIQQLMENVVAFINDNALGKINPLVKMALLHHQFESIHPFYDGNGRTGRILNVLYLVQQELLDLPILYLSRYIIRNKSDYYYHLQAVRDTGDWEPWLLYILKGIEQTARETTVLIGEIRSLMQNYKQQIRGALPKLYSQDLLNNLFRHPYTKVEFVMTELQVSRLTASNKLKALVKEGLLEKIRVGVTDFYVNVKLYNLLKGDVPYDQGSERITTRSGPDDGR